MPQPIPEDRLKQIATEACDAALAGVESYNHASTGQWNTTIINTLLKSLTTEVGSKSGPSADGPQPGEYKFCVTSTLIQHPSTPATSGDASDAAGTGDAAKPGRRGMHAAAGAYWNSETDGMWNFKYPGGEKRGLDVVVSVYWIGV